jgi:hypothetical protein
MDFPVCIYEALRLDGDAVACLIAPQVLAAGAHNTPTIDMSGHRRAIFIVLGGAANDQAATLNIVMQQCTQAADAGADAKILAGKRGTKAITQETSGAGFATLNDLWLLECRAEEMDVNNGFAFLRLVITVSAQDTWFCGVVAGRDVSGFKPVDHDNVDEIID